MTPQELNEILDKSLKDLILEAKIFAVSDEEINNTAEAILQFMLRTATSPISLLLALPIVFAKISATSEAIKQTKLD